MQDSSAKEKLYTKEYKRLKKELSYKSPEPSPCSSLEDSSESDGDKSLRHNFFATKKMMTTTRLCLNQVIARTLPESDTRS